jgi:hypothetical protein
LIKNKKKKISNKKLTKKLLKIFINQKFDLFLPIEKKIYLSNIITLIREIDEVRLLYIILFTSRIFCITGR